MWGRVRTRNGRLLASVAASERVGRAVRQHHLVGLGSAPVDASAVERHRFWCGVMRRLNALGANFMSPADKALVVQDIARRIPRPTLADRNAVTAAYNAEWEKEQRDS